MTLHRTLLTHHSSSNWIRASSSVSCFPPPVIHDPQASASACAGIVARSQSSRISAAAPRTTLDVTADAGASGCPLLLAARPLQSSCKTRSLSRCHRAVDFGFQTLKSPTAIAAKVCGGRFPGSMVQRCGLGLPLPLHLQRAVDAQGGTKRARVPPPHELTGHRCSWRRISCGHMCQAGSETHHAIRAPPCGQLGILRPAPLQRCRLLKRQAGHVSCRQRPAAERAFVTQLACMYDMDGMHEV